MGTHQCENRDKSTVPAFLKIGNSLFQMVTFGQAVKIPSSAIGEAED
jgi:hypothetical protein